MEHFGIRSNKTHATQKAIKPFLEYKQRLDLEAHLHYKKHFLNVNSKKEEKCQIKDSIRQQERKLFTRTSIINIILFIGVAHLTVHLIT